MATTVVLNDQIEIPFVASLAEFRQWALSDGSPDKIRIDYIAGRIEVEMSAEDLYAHGIPKIELSSVLHGIVKEKELGDVFVDQTRVSNVSADLSCEPDIVFVSHESIETGRVRLVPKAGHEDRYIELEGSPDLVVEIVSDNSVAKDTRRLPEAYWRADVPEFWLADARGRELVFQIDHRGVNGYEPPMPDAEGFQRSRVLDIAFRLTRIARPRGRWTYRVETVD
ncbi:MAG: Uma2 family endonuclease [Pirellulales bacterium]|nr:Uma2 family endonuclease [Pirellulales bacterium]